MTTDGWRVADIGTWAWNLTAVWCLVSGTTCGCGLLCFTPDVLLCVGLSGNLATHSPESSSLHAASRPICRFVLCNHVACLNSALPSRWLAYRQHSVFLCSPARISSGQLSCCCFVSCLGDSVPPESKVNPPPEAPVGHVPGCLSPGPRWPGVTRQGRWPLIVEAGASLSVKSC